FDHAIWEYDFHFTNAACWQTNGSIYWLSLWADCFDTNQFLFGWKTCPTNFNDDAVFGHVDASGAPLMDWKPLERPPDYTNSLDLAFEVITTLCPPIVVSCAPDKTVGCGSFWFFDPPFGVFDSCCGTNYTLSFTATTNYTCPQVAKGVFLVTDCLGYHGSCTQSVTIMPSGPLMLVCGTNKTIPCGTNWSFDTPVLTNTCCGTNFMITFHDITNGSPCGGTGMSITRSWTATDCCTNFGGCAQTITFPPPSGPILVCATNKTVACGTAWSFDPPTVTNTCCGTNVFVTVLNTVTNGTLCAG